MSFTSVKKHSSYSYGRTWKTKWIPRTLEGVFLPIVWLNYLFGLGIFEIPYGRPRSVLSAIYIAACAAGYYYCIQNFINLENFRYKNEMILYFSVLIVNVIVATCSIVVGCFNRENFRTIVTRCAKIDDTLEDLGVQKDYTHLFYRVMRCILICFFSVGLLFTFSIYITVLGVNPVQSVTLMILLQMPITLNAIVVVTFVSFLWCLEIQLKKMNGLIAETLKEAPTPKRFLEGTIRRRETILTFSRHVAAWRHPTELLKLVEAVRQLHLELCRISRQVNNTFCLQILLELTVHFTLVTGAAYEIYLVLTIPSSLQTKKEGPIASMTMWAVIYAFKVIMVNYICSTIFDEYKRTSQILQSYDVSLPNENMREEIHQFSLQILANPLHFTACGFFYLDNDFTRKFFGTVATYLVILIQMSDTPNGTKIPSKSRAD